MRAPTLYPLPQASQGRDLHPLPPIPSSPAPGTASLTSCCLLSQLTVVFDSFEECSSAASNLTLLAASLPWPWPLLSSMCTVPCPHPDMPAVPPPSRGPGLTFAKVAMTRAQAHGKHLTRGTGCWLWGWDAEGEMCGVPTHNPLAAPRDGSLSARSTHASPITRLLNPLWSLAQVCQGLPRPSTRATCDPQHGRDSHPTVGPLAHTDASVCSDFAKPWLSPGQCGRIGGGVWVISTP